MITNRQVLAVFKFGEYQYMKQLMQGTISFSCPGSYIEIAKSSGNEDQGDLYEGVFARLKKGDTKIDEMQKLLGDDLEILDDNTHVMLRRMSSYLIPTFCFYSLKASDITAKEITNVGWQYVRHDFDKTMYTGFGNYPIRNVLSNHKRPIMLYIPAAPFENSLNESLKPQGMTPVIRHVNYTEFVKDEFFIQPTDRRDELFYKFPQYQQQQETRICLINMSLDKISDRKNVQIIPISEAAFIDGETFLEVNVEIVEL